MTNQNVSGGTVHCIPSDLEEALISVPAALQAWESLTPLARNEWICWNTYVKLAETRKQHVERTVAALQEGKRRPCCWPGCIHRTDKAISPSVQGIMEKRSRSK